MPAFKTAAITVTTSRVKLTTFAKDSKGDFDTVVIPVAAGTVYIGGADVTTANGLPCTQDRPFSARVEADVYGVVASGTLEVRAGSMGVA